MDKEFVASNADEAVNVMEKLVEFGCGFNYVLNKNDAHQIRVRGGRMPSMALKLAIEQVEQATPVNVAAA